MSTFSSDKVSPVLRPETKDVKRAQASIFHYSALDSTIISYFHTFTSGITVHKGKIEAMAAYPQLNVKIFSAMHSMLPEVYAAATAIQGSQ